HGRVDHARSALDYLDHKLDTRVAHNLLKRLNLDAGTLRATGHRSQDVVRVGPQEIHEGHPLVQGCRQERRDLGVLALNLDSLISALLRGGDDNDVLSLTGEADRRSQEAAGGIHRDPCSIPGEVGGLEDRSILRCEVIASDLDREIAICAGHEYPLVVAETASPSVSERMQAVSRLRRVRRHLDAKLLR